MRDVISEGVRTITLEREPMNTLDLEAVEALSALFAAHPADTPLVLAGAGPAFCAGVDSRAFLGYAPAKRLELARAITRMTARLLAIPSPVVAAVGGHALGGGFVLALCCDYRVATDGESAKFGLLEAKAGIAFPSGPAEIVRCELPPTLARQLTLSCRTITSRLLLDLAVLDELAGPGDVLATAQVRALDLARLPGFGAVKAQMRGGLAASVQGLAKAGGEPAFDQLPEASG